MRIATVNVNEIIGRLPVLLRWFAEAEPDVDCLQELKAGNDRYRVAAFREAGFGVIWHGQKSWNGVAILARGADRLLVRRGLAVDGHIEGGPEGVSAVPEVHVLAVSGLVGGHHAHVDEGAVE